MVKFPAPAEGPAAGDLLRSAPSEGPVKIDGLLRDVERAMIRPVSIRVSLVEDDAPLRRILADWVRQAPAFEVVGECCDGQSALEALPGQQPDVVLVDINLPGLNGIECVRRLKPQLPQTQFVMLTVYDNADKIFSALAAGATGYLLKRTTQAELQAAIADVHRGGSPMTSHIARKVVQSLHTSSPKASEAAQLSPREREVLELLAKGYLYKEIADSLGLSVATVSSYIRNIYEKLHVHSRGQAVAKYLGA